MKVDQTKFYDAFNICFEAANEPGLKWTVETINEADDRKKMVVVATWIGQGFDAPLLTDKQFAAYHDTLFVLSNVAVRSSGANNDETTFDVQTVAIATPMEQIRTGYQLTVWWNPIMYLNGQAFPMGPQWNSDRTRK